MNTKFTHLFLILSISALITSVISCNKKKEASKATTPSDNPPATTNDYIGNLSCEQSYNFNTNELDSYLITINFNNTTENISNVDVGSVTVNQKLLKKNKNSNLSYIYSDTTRLIKTLPLIINVSGNQYFSSYGFNYTKGFPNYPDTNLIPEIANLSQGISFKMSPENADTVYATLNIPTLGLTLSKKTAVKSSEITIKFDSSEFIAINSGTETYLTIKLLKSVLADNSNKLALKLLKSYSQKKIILN